MWIQWFLSDLVLLTSSSIATAFIPSDLQQNQFNFLMGASHAKAAELHPNGKRENYKGVEYSDDGITVVGSLFGRIGDGTEAPSCEGSRELLYQDAHVACFIPMKAVHDQHVLVVPRCTYPQPSASVPPETDDETPPLQMPRHITTCADLCEVDRPLLQHMRSVGQLVLDSLVANAATPIISVGIGPLGQQKSVQSSAPSGACEASFVFHRPPYNSIDHLHLHCIGRHPPRRRPIDYVKYPPGLNVPWCVSLESILAQQLPKVPN